MLLREDERGFVRLTWAPGLRIDRTLAEQAMTLVDDLNAGRQRPLLVDMTATAELTRGARAAFARPCSASCLALLGRSPVDRILANFALGVSGVPAPTRFFTDESDAITWLARGPRPR